MVCMIYFYKLFQPQVLLLITSKHLWVAVLETVFITCQYPIRMPIFCGAKINTNINFLLFQANQTMRIFSLQVLHPAVGETRCDTMLPSILVSAVGRNYTEVKEITCDFGYGKRKIFVERWAQPYSLEREFIVPREYRSVRRNRSSSLWTSCLRQVCRHRHWRRVHLSCW